MDLGRTVRPAGYRFGDSSQSAAQDSIQGTGSEANRWCEYPSAHGLSCSPHPPVRDSYNRRCSLG